MKNILLTLSIVLFACTKSFAHYLWIETKAKGKTGKSQEVKVYFGEYTYGVHEKVNEEAFQKVANFTLWAVDAQGVKTALKTSPKENYYLAEFTPKTKGTYTLILDNNNIDVIDYTKYDFGIFKTHYHSIAKVQVGKNKTATSTLNSEGITVKEVPTETGKIKLQVLYKNKVLAKNKVDIYVSDLWSKSLTTDEQGFVSFKLPWKTQYVIETTYKEKTPGTYHQKEYEFVWHCVTYTIQ